MWVWVCMACAFREGEEEKCIIEVNINIDDSSNLESLTFVKTVAESWINHLCRMRQSSLQIQNVCFNSTQISFSSFHELRSCSCRLTCLRTDDL